MSRRRFLDAALHTVGAGHEIAHLVCEVSAQTGVPVPKILAKGRGKQRITNARQEAYRRASEAGFSLPEIGRFFHRDHTSILHGVRAATQRI